MLHATFYQAVITVHRPFIPQINNSDDPEIDRTTSFAICKNAARSLVRVVYTYATRYVQFRQSKSLAHRHHLHACVAVPRIADHRGCTLVDFMRA